METNNKWSSAALNGLMLALITIIYSLIQTVFEPNKIVSTLLWIIKLAGCIYLLYYFMKQYSKQFQQITYGQSFQYGFLVSFFSSIVCAGFTFLSMTLIFPDSIDKVIEQMSTVMASGNYTSEQEETMNAIIPKLPQIILFFGLIYYTIVGVVFSSIIASMTKKIDPFADQKGEENQPNTDI